MNSSSPFRVLPGRTGRSTAPVLGADFDPQTILKKLGCNQGNLARTLPFASGDLTAGSESELQAVVLGNREQVDLPLSIEHSGFFTNLLRRAQAGDAPESLVSRLESFLSKNTSEVWENSWVRFPRKKLGEYAGQVFEHDLLANKQNPAEGNRGDAKRFVVSATIDAEEQIRVPISYLVKLALADLIGSQARLPAMMIQTGRRLLDHYLSDNTSPETFSFNVVALSAESGMGKALAKETAQRFLFTHLLTCYANLRFGLLESGQQARIYFAPHPPIRQKELNDMIPDAFYRELFMSPCLSGWDRGEIKHRYMHLCHQVLSRSKLNAVAKLREAGIITNNLVVMPNMSNISLANNGTHISLGSRQLSRRMNEGDPAFGAFEEKYLGDLAIKIQEHFLPLFSGTFSGAPYRLGFNDFHPETALGFLPHQLDYTHLRMLWRRWKKKAKLSVLGHALTPFGPEWLDQGLSRVLGLDGDLVPDFRLIDYPVAFLSTARSPALSGQPGNHDQLKRDLDDMGVFDRQMSLYQFFKLREHGVMGFSGFEGRHYSLFENLGADLGGAASLQALTTALAFKYMAAGQLSHHHIPDDPVIESERRQIFFGMAVGIPTFYVKRNSRNSFLLKILRRTRNIRSSNRYPGYWRVHNRDYCLALLDLLAEDGADLIEAAGLENLMADLKLRLTRPEEYSTAGKLTRGILEQLGTRSPLKVKAQEFNRAAELYYRNDLCKQHLCEALSHLEQDTQRLNHCQDGLGLAGSPLNKLLENKKLFIVQARHELLTGTESTDTVTSLLNLMLLNFSLQTDASKQKPAETATNYASHTSIHRAG